MTRADSSDVRIALCSPYGLSRVSGVSQFVVDLRKALMTSNHEAETFAPEDVPLIHKLPSGFANIVLAVATLRRIALSRKSWTAIHGNQPHLQTVASLVAARVKGARSVVTIHSPFPPAANWRSSFAQVAAFRLLARYADQIVYVSEATKNDYGRGRGRVIRIGFDPGLVPSGFTVEPRSRTVFVALFSGRQTRIKGFFDLLDAIGEIASERGPSAIRLILIGDVRPEEAAERRRRIVLLGPIVEDRGFVADRAAVLQSFGEADVLVLPSYREGLPLVLLEAMAAGCVPIVSDVGGVKEVVENHRTGLIIPAGDIRALKQQIEWAMNHPNELQMMASAAQLVVKEKFTFLRTVEEYIDLYRETVDPETVHKAA